MSELGDVAHLDRRGTPHSPGSWDERSGQWLSREADGQEPRAATDADVAHRPGTNADGRPDAGRGQAREPYAARGPAREPGAARGHELGASLPSPAPLPPPAPLPIHLSPPPTTPPPLRRTVADPVKALMHRHRDLCERAVDPLEIAAGLEAHGVTDRTAARFRHRDVFSLAEEMYARIPLDGETPTPPAPEATSRPRADWGLLALLPGALCTATVIGLHLTQGRARLTVAAAGALTVALALRAALARGPLSPKPGTTAPATATATSTWTYWLLAYALLGDGLLRTALAGGPDGLPGSTSDAPWTFAIAPVLALAWACVPAAWSTHAFTARARRKLTASRGLEDFAASVRPLLLAMFALFLCALAALLALTSAVLDEPAAYAQTIALGSLLLLSRLLTIHRFSHAPAVILTATATAQATALATVFAARLPGCDLLSVPVQTLADTWGPAGIQTLTCGTGALILLLHATRTLTRASAHAPTAEQR